MKIFMIATMMLLAGATTASAKKAMLDPFEMTMPSYCTVKEIKEEDSFFVKCADTKAKGYKKDYFNSIWLIQPTGIKRDNLTQKHQAEVASDEKQAQKSVDSMKDRMKTRARELEIKIVGQPKVRMDQLGDVIATVGEVGLEYNEHLIIAQVWYEGEAWEVLVTTGEWNSAANLKSAKQSLSTLCFCAAN